MEFRRISEGNSCWALEGSAVEFSRLWGGLSAALSALEPKVAAEKRQLEEVRDIIRDKFTEV